jgi:type VI secretion system secreted protein Hcp
MNRYRAAPAAVAPHEKRAAPPMEGSDMAFPAYIAIKGIKQCQFKGETEAVERRDKWMEIFAFTMGLESALDAATGQPSGKPQYKPVTIVKQWGAASPQLLQACATSEVLTEVAIEFTRANSAGMDVTQAVKLTNASVAAVARFTGSPEGAEDTATSGHSKANDMQEYERVSFTFQKIEVTDLAGKTLFADDWTTRI